MNPPPQFAMPDGVVLPPAIFTRRTADGEWLIHLAGVNEAPGMWSKMVIDGWRRWSNAFETFPLVAKNAAPPALVKTPAIMCSNCAKGCSPSNRCTCACHDGTGAWAKQTEGAPKT